jgi:VIT1/CCC1 family predicted Fe2+/Mn2+ transporter
MLRGGGHYLTVTRDGLAETVMWQTQGNLSSRVKSCRRSIVGMTEPDSPGQGPAAGLPHQIDHRHADVTGGWLRAATFGAMDGLVSNTALIAGVAASASAQAVVLSGVAGLLAGAFSMALGEYTSVTTANEQVESEVRVERRSFRQYPDEERAELVAMLMDMGMTQDTATKATEEIHRDEARALNFHLVQELGVDPSEKPSPWIAAGSSFAMFAIGAVVPLIPYLLGYESLWLGLAFGGLGLLIAGGTAARFTRKSTGLGALRQLAFGAIAIGATYVVGTLIGTAVT